MGLFDKIKDSGGKLSNLKDTGVEKVKSTLPPLPKELFQKFTKEFFLSDYDVNILGEKKGIAFYFNTLCNCTKNYKAAANFVMGSVKSHLNETATDIVDFSISAKNLANIFRKMFDEFFNNFRAKL